LGTSFESITRRQQHRLVLAVQDDLLQRGLQEQPWRIDAIAVRLDSQGVAGSFDHLENAATRF
jgi:Holliday junction resolvase-like predicted endonuclease